MQAGKALLVLAPSGDLQLVLQIDERNLGKLALRTERAGLRGCLPGPAFRRKVSYINPGIDISRATVQVKLTVVEPSDDLRQDMTVSVDIQVAAKDNAKVLPVRSVHDVLSGQPWVLTVEGGRAVKRPVKLGLRGNSNIEIVEGLEAGDVAIPQSSGVVTGQRLRPVRP